MIKMANVDLKTPVQVSVNGRPVRNRVVRILFSTLVGIIIFCVFVFLLLVMIPVTLTIATMMFLLVTIVLLCGSVSFYMVIRKRHRRT